MLYTSTFLSLFFFFIIYVLSFLAPDFFCVWLSRVLRSSQWGLCSDLVLGQRLLSELWQSVKLLNYLTASPGSRMLAWFVPFCSAAFCVMCLKDWRLEESLLFWYGLFVEPRICHALAWSGLKYIEEEQMKKDSLVAELNLVLLCHIMPWWSQRDWLLQTDKSAEMMSERNTDMITDCFCLFVCFLW